MFIFFFCSCYKVKLLCSSSVFFFTSLSFICLLLSSFFLSVCISSFISLLLSTFAHLPYCLLFIFLLFFFFFYVPSLLMVLFLPLSVVVDVVGWPLLSIALQTAPLSLAVCLSPLPLSAVVRLRCPTVGCLAVPVRLCMALYSHLSSQPSISISVFPSIRPLVCIVLSTCLPLFSRRSCCNS